MSQPPTSEEPSRSKATKAEGTSNPTSQRPERDPSALVGEIVSGRYRIERLLGEGGMGAVYQAEHTHMRKRLAVKILHSDMSRMPEVVARFEREAMAAAHIDHPNVAAATDFGKLPDGSFFLVLEYVEGRSLRRAIDREAPMTPARSLTIVRQIGLALERAHALNIVHRDLKPENVMLVERPGEPDFVKVLDFGIAKVPVGELAPRHKNGTDPAAPPQILTQAGMVYGTPEYMAPEQALGQEVDARADLYALGVMMFELLTGVRPYEADSKVALLGLQVTAPIPQFSDRAPGVKVPPAVEALTRRLLQKEARDRVQTAAELVADVDALLAGLGRTYGSTQPPPPALLTGPLGTRTTTGEMPTASDPAVRTEMFEASQSVQASLMARQRPRTGLFVVAGASVAALVAVVAIGFAFRSFRNHLDSASNAQLDGAIGAVDGGQLAETPLDGSATASNGTANATGPTVDAAVAPEMTASLRAEEKAAVAQSKWKRVVDVIRDILQIDPAAANEDALVGDLRNAALDMRNSDHAIALIVTLGARGADVLYNIVTDPNLASARFAGARKRALNQLRQPETRSRVSPQLDIVLQLRDAKPCDGKPLLAKATEVGDFRATPILSSWSKSACYANDTELANAITTTSGRKYVSPSP